MAMRDAAAPRPARLSHCRKFLTAAVAAFVAAACSTNGREPTPLPARATSSTGTGTGTGTAAGTTGPTGDATSGPSSAPAAGTGPPSTAAAGTGPPSTAAAATGSSNSTAGIAQEARSIECTQLEAHIQTSFAAGPDDVVAGSISWPGLRGWASAAPSDIGGPGTADHKIGAVVRAGQVVTVAVADDAAGLNYGQRWGYSPARTVTFHACPTFDTAFIGGFHVAGRRCVPLVVTEAGRPPVRVTVSFFTGQC
jgi:hypothetical protein